MNQRSPLVAPTDPALPYDEALDRLCCRQRTENMVVELLELIETSLGVSCAAISFASPALAGTQVVVGQRGWQAKDADHLDAITPDATHLGALASDALAPDALAPDALAPDALQMLPKLCRWVAAHNQPIVSDDLQKAWPAAAAELGDQPEGAWLQDTLRLRFWVGLPIAGGGTQSVGTLLLGDFQARHLSEAEQRSLELWVGQVRNYLELRTCAAHLEQVVAERRRLTAIARQSETMLHSLATPDHTNSIYPVLLRTARNQARSMLVELSSLSAFGTEMGMILSKGGELSDMLHHCAQAMETHFAIATGWFWVLNSASQRLELQYTNADETVPADLFPATIALDNPDYAWLVYHRHPYLDSHFRDTHGLDEMDDGGLEHNSPPPSPTAAMPSAAPALAPRQAFAQRAARVAAAANHLPFTCNPFPPSPLGLPRSEAFWEWCDREHFVTFGRYPLMVEGRLVGIFVILGRDPLLDNVARMLEWAANSLAVTIDRFWVREALLHHREDLMLRLASQIHNSLDLDTILQTGVDEIRTLLQIDHCHFVWYLPHPEHPSIAISHQAQAANLSTLDFGATPAQTGAIAAAILNLRVVQLDQVTHPQDPEDQDIGERLVNLGIASYLLVPLKTRSGQFGAIACSQCAEVRAWNAGEVELLQAVVDQLAIAIDQAELYAQTRAAAFAAQTQAQQLSEALRNLKQTEAQLVQSEKMSSLGQMVAGVAHEINNPVSFIYGNLEHAQNYASDTLELLRLYQKHFPEPPDEIADYIEDIDLEFLMEDLPKLLSSMEIGTERIRQIVMSLRNFSRLDESAVKQVDIHEGIDSTLLILQNRLKPSGSFLGVTVTKHYGDLPLVECYAGQLNQVFMNVLTNAIDAMEANQEPGQIEITTSMVPLTIEDPDAAPIPHALIQIRDNGPGMPETVRAKLFDPFFTTKPVGKGTGLGLSIGYQIVVEKHGGRLECQSQAGQGTEFSIYIPVVLPDYLRDRNQR
jgi:signal transduction histidine kinase